MVFSLLFLFTVSHCTSIYRLVCSLYVLLNNSLCKQQTTWPLYFLLESQHITLVHLISPGSSPPTPRGEKVAAALAVGCSVSAQSHNVLEFCLAWDMPKITFGSREREHVRYTSWSSAVFWEGVGFLDILILLWFFDTCRRPSLCQVMFLLLPSVLHCEVVELLIISKSCPTEDDTPPTIKRFHNEIQILTLNTCF